MSVLVVGSVAMDSLETPFGKRDNILGGSATYFSIAASFFNRVDIVAVVGEDFPERYLEIFKKKGVGTRGLETAKGKTFRWKGRYDYDLNTARTIHTHLNVFRNFKPVIPDGLRDTKFLFLANIDPELQYGVLRQMRGPKLVACDSMNYWIETRGKALKRLLAKVDIFLLNEAEARQLSGDANLLKAANSIRKMGPKAVVIKKGEHGVLYRSGKSFFAAPAYPLESVYDPTGAGDTFAGGMFGFLSGNGKITDAVMRKAIVYGTIMASFAVEDFGACRMLRLSLADIKKRYCQFRCMTKF